MLSKKDVEIRAPVRPQMKHCLKCFENLLLTKTAVNNINSAAGPGYMHVAQQHTHKPSLMPRKASSMALVSECAFIGEIGKLGESVRDTGYVCVLPLQSIEVISVRSSGQPSVVKAILSGDLDKSPSPGIAQRWQLVAQRTNLPRGRALD
ncbi:hypothetical protein DNTS_018402 [Danionella cerebrum]|uniref:Uncharacterized protein n=1 Tax=Danionella cerebrum TaxID=2873325 RepID=A0A553QWP0_9TELE|nr:hypothetical protein DNTS_018402 [Danionella translucida]